MMLWFKRLKNKKGQSAIEFLILVPILVYCLIVTYQVFSMIMTSLVNQEAARFTLFNIIDNHRGRAEKVTDSSISGATRDPIFPGLETYSETYRSTNTYGNVSNTASPPKEYFAVKVEEPRGSGLWPRRDLSTLGTKTVEIKTKYGVYERK